MTSASASPDYRVKESSVGLAVVVGLIDVVLGGLLLFNLRAAVATIVLIVGLGLIAGAAGELLVAEKRTAGVWLAAALLFAGGVAALVWPGMTLWALALVAGFSLLAAGITTVVLAFLNRSDVGWWGLRIVGGVVTVAVGILALAWPAATVAVLALIFAVRILVSGVIILVAAKKMHDWQGDGGNVAQLR